MNARVSICPHEQKDHAAYMFARNHPAADGIPRVRAAGAVYGNKGVFSVRTFAVCYSVYVNAMLSLCYASAACVSGVCMLIV